MGHEALALEAAQRTAADLDVRLYVRPGFATRGHYPMSRVGAVMWHDTVTRSTLSQQGLWNLLTNGHTGLPGPIANMGVDRDGTIGLIAAEGAYHAGRGGPWEDIGRNRGNRETWGIEVANAGYGSGERWTGIQYEVCVAFSHHLLSLVRRPLRMTVGHGAPSWNRPPTEWTTRKIDPWSMNMNNVRRAVRDYRRPTPEPPPPDPNSWEGFMADLTNAQKKALTALSAMSDDQANQIVRMARQIEVRESSGMGVVNAIVDDARQRRDVGFGLESYAVLQQFIGGMEEMGTTPRTLGGVLVAMVRAARANGWVVDRDAFRENAHYRWGDSGYLEYSTDRDTWQPVVGPEGEQYEQPRLPLAQPLDDPPEVGTSDSEE